MKNEIRHINEVKLIGEIKRDLKLLGSGKRRVLSMSLVTTQTWRDSSSGEVQSRDAWHEVVVFGSRVESIYAQLNRGDIVYVSGALKYVRRSGESATFRAQVQVSDIAHTVNLLSSGGAKSLNSAPGNGRRERVNIDPNMIQLPADIRPES
ncbi:single-stranded DNA-binding protein [Vibrio sp. PNB22_3_1]